MVAEYMGTCIHGYTCTRIHGRMHTWVHAYNIMGTWVHAYMGTCIHGYMHTWVHAYMGTCMWGEQGWFSLHFYCGCNSEHFGKEVGRQGGREGQVRESEKKGKRVSEG